MVRDEIGVVCRTRPCKAFAVTIKNFYLILRLNSILNVFYGWLICQYLFLTLKKQLDSHIKSLHFRQEKRELSRVCEYKACPVKNTGNSGELMVVMVSFSFKSPHGNK